MQFLILEYGTRPAPQAVKRGRKNERTKSETKNPMQWARPDDADGDEGRAGTPPKKGKGGRKRRSGDDDGSDDEDDGNENERQHREKEKGEKKKKERTEKREATTTQPQQAQPDSIRTIQTAQKPLTPPK